MEHGSPNRVAIVQMEIVESDLVGELPEVGLADFGQLFVTGCSIVNCGGTFTLDDFIRVPDADGSAIGVGAWDGPRRVAPYSNEPPGDLAALDIVKQRQALAFQGRGFLAVSEEQYVGLAAKIAGATDSPEDSLADLARIGPAHAAVDAVERSQQVIVVVADFDRGEQDECAVLGKDA